MRILLVEDDPSAAAMAERMLKAEGFHVDPTELGEDAIELGKIYDYDAILLDVLLPDMEGYEVLRRLRNAKVTTPVLMVSGLGEIDSKLKALGQGADDYVTKPYDRRELVARIHATIRRSRGHADNTIRIGRLAINMDKKTVEANGAPLKVTVKEYGILELLALRQGTTLGKESFLTHLYNGMDEPDMKIIDVFICKLRKKLSSALGDDYIQTVWGRGYTLRAPQAHDRAAAE